MPKNDPIIPEYSGPLFFSLPSYYVWNNCSRIIKYIGTYITMLIIYSLVDCPICLPLMYSKYIYYVHT